MICTVFFVRLAKEAVICVQLRDDQFFWSLPEMRVAFSSSSNAVAAPRSEWQVCHVVFINLGLRRKLWISHKNRMSGSSPSAASLVNTSPCVLQPRMAPPKAFLVSVTVRAADALHNVSNALVSFYCHAEHLINILRRHDGRSLSSNTASETSRTDFHARATS